MENKAKHKYYIYIIIYTSLKRFSHTGAFGKVFEGVLNDPDRNIVDVTVAIKTIKSTITLKHICTQY